ncbi:spore germination protein [Paenisporosarcina cavernae]|uniref:spore germination protein n=1 Tax=Paenisporosarcina cavernae TaxID=2320858 RepID=UPI0013C49E31|nr:spore germination protein [Paenisporosarcina cavernae]
MKIPTGKLKKDKSSTLKETTIPHQTIVDEFNHVHDFLQKKLVTNIGDVILFYLYSMVDHSVIYQKEIKPLLENAKAALQDGELLPENDLAGIINAISIGHIVVYVEETKKYYKFIAYSAPTRSIGTSEIETTVIGPQDSFTESLQTNLSLLKRRIHTPHFKTKSSTIGTESHTEICTVYMKNIVSDDNIGLIEERLRNVNNPSFQDISILKQMLEDNPFSPFPQFIMTNRPDTAVKYIMDGRIVVLMDNSSSIMITPSSFLEMFLSSEDYYNRWTTASLLRLIRFIGFFITVILTPAYISIMSFHPGVVPIDLLMRLQESRSKVPFPPVFEVIFIELVIEVLREAGARMPTKIGQTIGIVGGIVIGTAAVEAGLVSNVLIVLVAISALLSFMIPNYLMSNASRLIRYFFIIAAGAFGFLGLTLALAWLMNHLLNLTSLGKPYVSPVVPRRFSDVYDGIVRAPLTFIQNRKRLSMSKQPTFPTKREKQ